MKPSDDTPTTNMTHINTAEKLLQLSLLPAVNLPNFGYSNSNFVYKFLDDCQKTSIAVTAVHTPEEMNLFKRLIVEEYSQIYMQTVEKKKEKKKIKLTVKKTKKWKK
jgi:hypothetical protein